MTAPSRIAKKVEMHRKEPLDLLVVRSKGIHPTFEQFPVGSGMGSSRPVRPSRTLNDILIANLAPSCKAQSLALSGVKLPSVGPAIIFWRERSGSLVSWHELPRSVCRDLLFTQCVD